MELKVSGIKTFLVDNNYNSNWLFVKVETSDGLFGWGEAYSYRNRGKGVVVHIENFGRHLIGRSALNIRHFTQLMYDDLLGRRGGVDSFIALAAIEMALWDIVGKYAKLPVYNLLGGACRDKIKVYGDIWGAKTPQEYGAKAVELVKKGFKALKLDVGSSASYRSYNSHEEEMEAVAKVKEIRKAVGDDIEILAEGHRRLSPMYANRLGRMLEEYRLFWYEEPVPVEDLDGLAEVRRNLKIPIVTGETLYTKAAYRNIFQKRAADMINPEITATGILELREIAALAEAFDVSVALHNASISVGLAASLQAAACIPNFVILECQADPNPRGAEIGVQPYKVENGYIKVPALPGLGLDLDEERLKKYPYKEPVHKGLRQYYQEGP